MLSFVTTAILAVLVTSSVAAPDVSIVDERQYIEDPEVPPPPPRPYLFSYAAGRFPGHYDRKHAEVGDGRGFVKGSYSVLNPWNQIHTVDYTADRYGFHAIVSDPLPDHPADTKAVQLEKQKHFYLYNKIAQEQAEHPHPEVGIASVPRDTVAVAREKHHQAVLYQKIAQEHARIAAEREAQKLAFEATSIRTELDDELKNL